MKKTNQAPEKKARTQQKSTQQKAPAQAMPASQRGWKEVAMIDFTGYTDRDCEERIIYKTPAGELKAALHLRDGTEVIEDVTRKQVTQWLAQCVIPEEFEKDFSTAPTPSRHRDLLIPDYRSEELRALADAFGVTPIKLAERVISDYLLFVEQYPHWAQAQPRFVHATVPLAVFPSGPFYDRLSELCEVYLLDANSVADAALRAFGKFARRFSEDQPLEIDFASSKTPGAMCPENFLYILTEAQSPEQCTFAKIANRMCDQDFESACGDLAALRSLVMYHPGFEAEREALEMISDGANRLWASPAQTTWRETKAK